MNKYILSLLIGASALAACDDDTSLIGIDVMPEADNITTHSEIFPVVTSTVKVDAVLANTKNCHLGSIVDPEMHVRTTSDFLAQFHLPENFKLPGFESMYKENGQIVADSCDIQLFFDRYYGDSLTTMKLDVQELSRTRFLEESENYYTNLDPNLFLDPDTETRKSLTYTIKDLSRPDNKEAQRRILIRLPREYATNILRSYYENPGYFTNSYQFIHHVCPGFYFKHAGGVGSMIVTKNMALNVYFKHSVKLTEEKDTIIDGMQRFGATEEVIQCSSIDNQYPGSLVDELLAQKNCTYVKTPASLFTEMQIPVGHIVGGEHVRDSINLAQIIIRKYNNESQSPDAFATPDYLLMVRKSKATEFFEKRQLPDYKESYLTTKFNAAKNSYTFNNIAQLITTLKIEREAGAQILPTDTDAQRQAKYEAWQAEHPDWNKVMLIPVQAVFISSSDYYGQPVEKLQAVQHDLGLTSAKLEGGTEKPLNIKVIYSRYNR